MNATMEETKGHWNAANLSMREEALKAIGLGDRINIAPMPWDSLPEDVREILRANLYTKKD